MTEKIYTARPERLEPAKRRGIEIYAAVAFHNVGDELFDKLHVGIVRDRKSKLDAPARVCAGVGDRAVHYGAVRDSDALVVGRGKRGE